VRRGGRRRTAPLLAVAALGASALLVGALAELPVLIGLGAVTLAGGLVAWRLEASTGGDKGLPATMMEDGSAGGGGDGRESDPNGDGGGGGGGSSE
jgi:hypothetical protein